MTYSGLERGQIPHTPLRMFVSQMSSCMCVLCGYQVLTEWLCVLHEPGQPGEKDISIRRRWDTCPYIVADVLHMLILKCFKKKDSIKRVL